MNVHTLMNSTLTRVQAFVVVALCAVLLLGGLGVLLLQQMSVTHEEPLIVGGHGIETSWTSDKGRQRLWSVSTSGDYRGWIDDHIAALSVAEAALPPTK
jgi:hypothetical protein